jgi:hypothetical protein
VFEHTEIDSLSRSRGKRKDIFSAGNFNDTGARARLVLFNRIADLDWKKRWRGDIEQLQLVSARLGISFVPHSEDIGSSSGQGLRAGLGATETGVEDAISNIKHRAIVMTAYAHLGPESPCSSPPSHYGRPMNLDAP